MVPTTLWQTVTRVITTSWQVVWLVLLLAPWPQVAGACRYTVRDVAMVDLAEPHYVLCLVTKDGLTPSQARSLATAAAPILVDSNVEFRLVDAGRLEKGQPAIDPVDVSIQAAMETLAIVSYPAAMLLAPDGRTLRLPLTDEGLVSAVHSIPIASLRQLLRSAITSPRRDELLHYLLRGHSVVLVVEGTDRANNERAISWVEDAIARIRDALPTMAKPIELPPRMIRFSPKEAKCEEVLLWSLGVDLPQEASPATQIALLFGRGRKLGSVLRIPGSRQQDLWRGLGVVGEDCECGLDRGWMRGPMIPHAWSTTDEVDAVAALGFDPGNPLVKAEISRILARGPWQSGNAESGRANQSLRELLSPQLQLVEIDIDELTAAAEAAAIHPQPARDTSGVAGQESPTPQTKHPDSLPVSHSDTLKSAQISATGAPATGQVMASRVEDARSASLFQAADQPGGGTSTARDAITWVLLVLILVGVLGSLGIILRGRRKQG